ncbi:hypothetical protein RMATCC62417_12176 [Rhizopus microsporus]|nr:hypothetical protein RMATCC62417_12176 [Rhizopus microsporus]
MNLASDKKEQECESCVQLNDKDRDPMDAAHCCSTCIDQWKALLGDLLEKIQSLAVNTSAGKKKKVKLDKSIQEQPSTKKEKQPQQRTRGKKSVIPPTQSRHSQSTNKKMETFVSTGAFMTRKTAETLADPENGFYPNPYGYVHLQVVEVLNINGIWYRGTLEKMDKGKVKVKYSDWDDREWIIMGSRRLRIVPSDVIAKERDEEKKEKDSSKDVLTVIPRAKGRDDDYVSSTLDKDPQQLFNDNEVFMTRRMARAMVDEYGFRPNSFGYRRNRAVAVTFNVKNKECIGFLREMRDDQVRVWYPDLYQSEWIRVGSRRLRLLSSEEEEKYKQQVDLDVQEVPAVIEQKKVEDESKATTSKESAPEPKTKKLRQKKAKSKAPTPEPETHQEKQQQKEPQKPAESSFLTTGAFATRRAMRQLQDENGFVPNPYNYTYNQPVEILNTRSGKTHFWECGRLVAMRPGQVKVHYDGWDEAYDEWVMVGSRRIRILSKEEEENKKKHNELLVAEANPEVQDEAKRKRKHQVIRPEDYAKLGLLESEQIVIKQKKKVSKEVTPVESDSSSSEEEEEEYEEPSIRRRSRKAGKNKKKKAVKQKQQLQQQQNVAEYLATAAGVEEEKQIISLRVAQAKASEKYEFVANVYGYDYMQHVTVLNLDKKMYEARLVSMHKNKVKVHYCGWPDIFDEYITVGSRRIQPIENDHQVECIEPDYRERYEKIMQDGPTECQHQHQHQHQPAPKKLNRKRLTLDDVQEEEGEGEYHKEPNEEEEDIEVVEMDSWKVYCNQCNVVIKQFRYYCTYCENPSIGYDYRSFELCLRCFDQNFPFWHEHPRSSFAIQAVIDAEAGPRPIKGELVTVWEEDVLEEEHQQEEQDASSIFTGETAIEGDQGYKFLKRWKRRKVCAFCNDDDDTSEDLGSFIGPFIIATYNKNGVEKKRSFWAHDACARYSPEVFCTPEGKWYNVTLALRRGRGMRCYVCKEKGATIGCFESKCSKSFHLPCSQKPVSYFKSGVIFWCSVHEAYYNKKDTYVNVFNCDGCGKKMEEESWFTCVPCSSSSYFSSFDLCNGCFEKFPEDHPHNEDDFEETSLAIIKEMEAQKAREAARKKEEAREANAKKKKLLFPRKRRKLPDGSAPVSCCYCGTTEAESWRKAYDGGVMMCNPCFELALMVDNDERPTSDMPLVIHNAEQQYMTSIEDYSHKPYFTREAAIKIDSEAAVVGQRLTSKVDFFIRRKERELESRIAYCERSQPYVDIRKECIDILADLRELAKFIRVNYGAIEQLIQEHDTLLSLKCPLLVEARCLDTQRLDALYSKLMLLSKNDANEQVQYYLLKPEYIEEIKAILIFHYPQCSTDKRTVTSIFADDNHLSHYTSLLERDEDATVVHGEEITDELRPKLWVDYQCQLSYHSTGLSVSLYTDVMYSIPWCQRVSCPFALLEIKSNTDLSWLLPGDLLQSVPRFSIFIDGIARLYFEQLILLPAWLCNHQVPAFALWAPPLSEKEINGSEGKVTLSMASTLTWNTSSSFKDAYYQGRNNQSVGYSLIQNDEEEEGKEEKPKKKKKKQSTLEPKIFFANERTFIHWLKFSMLLLTAALTLLNFGDYISMIAGSTFFGIAAVIALYAFGRYRYRAYQIHNTPHMRYDDLFGPFGLCCLLVAAMVLNFVLRWEHPSTPGTYLGTNNQTRQQ